MREKLYGFAECIGHCRFLNLPDGLERYYDLYEDTFQSEIIKRSFLEASLHKFNVPITKSKLMGQALDEIEKDNILCYFTKFLIWDMCQANKRQEDKEYNNLLPMCLQSYREYYPFILLLSCVEPSMQMLQERGIPLELYEEIPYTPMRKQLEKWVMQDDITVSDFPWDMNFYTCSIFYMDRFYFIPYQFEDNFNVYRNRLNNRTVALQHASYEFRRDGQVNGTNEIQDEEGKFLTMWEEDELTIQANPINPMGFVEKTPIILHKADWEQVLKKGDMLLGFHIPEGPGYTPQRVRYSMELALNFFSTYFGELCIKGFWSESWLYDSRLSLIMEQEKSNIIKVQRQFYLYPIKNSDDMILERVFGEKNIDLSKVNCSSSLQKAIIRYMYTGARFNTLNMFVLKEDVADIGNCPYISEHDIAKFKTVVDSHLV